VPPAGPDPFGTGQVADRLRATDTWKRLGVTQTAARDGAATVLAAVLAAPQR
jgi:hypothetical protein